MSGRRALRPRGGSGYRVLLRRRVRDVFLRLAAGHLPPWHRASHGAHGCAAFAFDDPSFPGISVAGHWVCRSALSKLRVRIPGAGSRGWKEIRPSRLHRTLLTVARKVVEAADRRGASGSCLRGSCARSAHSLWSLLFALRTKRRSAPPFRARVTLTVILRAGVEPVAKDPMSWWDFRAIARSLYFAALERQRR